MFSRFIQHTLTRRLTRTPLRIRRMNSTTAESSIPPPPPVPKKKRISDSFDKSIYYPAFLVVLLGSQVINVMNAQRRVEDLDRRYTLKMEKIDELIKRVQNGEQVDVEREMRLVNKLFERSGSYTVMGKDSISGKVKKQKELAWQEEDLTEVELAKMLGLDLNQTKKDMGIADDEKESEKSTKTKVEGDVILVDRGTIDEQMKKEKELLNYRLNPDQHLIVEKAGDYVDAAKDTQVKKFL
ncbi:CYFA0S04e05666g1_1 [Cyberlindnera fabianii]|uniref:CYFA0S04e05666g1_1 n=1 Tax=Cyberlindnera fabianii TaxID=36022 RepID=A0A061ARC6_CYBFA|nr:CYFA0S04e05666g1_1 [Cyberlindnera fabianii]